MRVDGSWDWVLSHSHNVGFTRLAGMINRPRLSLLHVAAVGRWCVVCMSHAMATGRLQQAKLGVEGPPQACPPLTLERAVSSLSRRRQSLATSGLTSPRHPTRSVWQVWSWRVHPPHAAPWSERDGLPEGLKRAARGEPSTTTHDLQQQPPLIVWCARLRSWARRGGREGEVHIGQPPVGVGRCGERTGRTSHCVVRASHGQDAAWRECGGGSRRGM